MLTGIHMPPPSGITLAVPQSHIGPDKLDLDLNAPGWAASRCAGEGAGCRRAAGR